MFFSTTLGGTRRVRGEGVLRTSRDTARRKDDGFHRAVLLVALLSVVAAGCVRFGNGRKRPHGFATPKESFSIGAFKPSTTEYNFRHYDGQRVHALLSSIGDRFSDGDIVAVDGLKFAKHGEEWEPFPNPPVPVLEQGESVGEHLQRYAEWINNHPHFGHPPLPMQDRE